jgi:hypothetical protein
MAFVALALLIFCSQVTSPLQAQPKPDGGRFESSVLDEEAFDIITLTSEWQNVEVRVFPVAFPGGKVPTRPEPESDFEVKLHIYPERLYRISWKDIAKYETYESLVLSEAKRLLGSKKFAEAFEHLSFMLQNYPKAEGLDSLRQEFLLTGALDALRSSNTSHAFTMLEEFVRIYPDNQRTPQVKQKISEIAGQMLEEYFNRGELTTTRLMLVRLEKDYKDPPLPIISTWKQRFIDYADTFRQKAIEFREAGNFPDARTAAMQMLAIEPEIEGGRQLLRDLIAAYPMVRVGVFQKADRMDVTEISDWPVRRTGSLVSQPLFDFRNTGPEGGTYKQTLGSYIHSDDRTELEMKISDAGKQGVPTAYEISQWMLRRAEYGGPEYFAPWAAIMKQVQVAGPERLVVQLQRPHVLPHAFLQWPLDSLQSRLFRPNNFYARSEDHAGNRQSFRWAKEASPADGQPIEIVEIQYNNPKEAVAHLLKGELEVIDRLFPSDVRDLKGKREIRVESYALPIVHMLVPKSDHPFLKDRDFRRAMLYAVNRQAILDGELLGGDSRPDSRLISGPFPIGSDENDPLAYAYNKDVSNFPYDPRLAQLLVVVTTQKLKTMAVKAGEPEPQLKPLKLGVPDYEAARVAGEAFVQQWKLIGIPAEVVVMEAGMSDEQKKSLDVVYLSAALWEPAVDAERLFGEGGLAESDNIFIVQVLASLRTANNWREVRQYCQDLHTLVAAHLPVLPLWQVGESFAYRTSLQGIPKRPVTLYQDVQRWRITVGE